MQDVDRTARKFVFDYFLQQGSAPALEEIASHLGTTLAEGRDVLSRLDAGHQLKLLENTDRILMAFPFSAISTPYRVVRQDGRRYFANCAWDSIAFHPMLAESIGIESFCSHCGAPVQFRLEGHRGKSTSGPLPLVHLRLPAAEWWKDITRTCANTMVFLSSGDHVEGDPDPRTWSDRGIVTVDQVVQMSLPIYTTKMQLGYDRPAVEVVRANYERIGLTGPYWKI